MPGMCEFSDPSNNYWDYDYEYHNYGTTITNITHDYDYAEVDKDECLQSCLEKRRSVDNAVGCYFETWGFINETWGTCIFIKTGTIVGSSGDSDIGTCWKFN